MASALPHRRRNGNASEGLRVAQVVQREDGRGQNRHHHLQDRLSCSHPHLRRPPQRPEGLEGETRLGGHRGESGGRAGVCHAQHRQEVHERRQQREHLQVHQGNLRQGDSRRQDSEGRRREGVQEVVPLVPRTCRQQTRSRRLPADGRHQHHGTFRADVRTLLPRG